MDRIMIITKFIPAPAFNGGAIRSRAWIRSLSKHYKIVLFGFWDKTYGKKRLSEITEYVEEVYGFDFVRTKKSMLLTGLNAMKTKQAFVLQQYYLPEMKKKIDDVIYTKNIKMIFCEELSTMQYVNHISGIPIIFDDHNIEFELQERSVNNSVFWLRPIIKRQACYVKQFEKSAWEKATLCYFVSDRDCKIAQQYSDKKRKFDVVDNTFPSEGICSKDLSQWYHMPTCAFVGNLSWKPNRQGLIHFLSNIYPEIKKQIPDARFMLLGSMLPKELKKYINQSGVIVRENISEDEKREILSKCWLTLVPLYIGSGTRIKILEYWAHSKAVLSTSIGAEGLRRSAGTIIKDSDRGFIQAAITLLKDKQQLFELGKSNGQVFKNYYEETTVNEDSLYLSISARLNEQGANK